MCVDITTVACPHTNSVQHQRRKKEKCFVIFIFIEPKRLLINNVVKV